MNAEDEHLLKGGFNEIGFSNMQGDNNGTLDQYCGMEQAFYFIALCIMFVHHIPTNLFVV